MTDESELTSVPRPPRRPEGLAERIPDWPVQPEVESIARRTDLRLPTVLFPGEADWMRSLSPEDRQIFANVGAIEGGFTDTHIDGETTLFGVTAATLATYSPTYLGARYTEEEAAAYLRWMADGLQEVAGAREASGDNLRTRSTTPTGDATSLQLEHLAFFHDQVVPSLYYNEFVANPGFDRIEDPEVRELLVSISINKGPRAAAYVLDTATHGILLEYTQPPGTNPSTDAESIYRTDPNYSTNAVVDRYNAALPVAEANGFDTGFFSTNLAGYARDYYEEYAADAPGRERFLDGWLNRIAAHRDTGVTPPEGPPEPSPYEVRIADRLQQENMEWRAREHTPDAPIACVVDSVIRDVSREGEVLRQYVSGQVINTDTAELCTDMQGRPVPRATGQSAGLTEEAASRG